MNLIVICLFKFDFKLNIAIIIKICYTLYTIEEQIMSVKIYINECDDERTKLSKIEKTVADYGKELYEKCYQSSLCSEEAKRYITTNMCHNFAYSGLMPALLLIPSEQEVEIQISPVHIMQIAKFVEKRLQEENLSITEESLSQ